MDRLLTRHLQQCEGLLNNIEQTFQNLIKEVPQIMDNVNKLERDFTEEESKLMENIENQCERISKLFAEIYN